MTYKRFSRCLGYCHPPKKWVPTPKRSKGRPNQFGASCPQMGPRRYAACRELLLRGIGLQRRYPIWGLRACPQNHAILRCHFTV